MPCGVGVALQVFVVVVAEILLVAVPIGGVVVSGVKGLKALLVGGSLRFEEGVLLYLLLDGLFKVSDGQLQQPHQLYLLR